MRPPAGVDLVHHRDRQGGARTPAGVGKRQVGGATHRLTEHVPEPQGVDQCRAVLHLTGGPDHGRLAIPLDGVSAAGEVHQPWNENLTEARGHLEDCWTQVLNEPLAGPWVGQHGGDSQQSERRVGGSAPFDVDLLGVGYHLAQVKSHHATSAGSDWSVKCGITCSVNRVMLSMTASWGTPGKLDHNSSVRRFNFSRIS